MTATSYSLTPDAPLFSQNRRISKKWKGSLDLSHSTEANKRQFIGIGSRKPQRF